MSQEEAFLVSAFSTMGLSGSCGLHVTPQGMRSILSLVRALVCACGCGPCAQLCSHLPGAAFSMQVVR